MTAYPKKTKVIPDVPGKKTDIFKKISNFLTKKKLKKLLKYL